MDMDSRQHLLTDPFAFGDDDPLCVGEESIGDDVGSSTFAQAGLDAPLMFRKLSDLIYNPAEAIDDFFATAADDTNMTASVLVALVQDASGAHVLDALASRKDNPRARQVYEGIVDALLYDAVEEFAPTWQLPEDASERDPSEIAQAWLLGEDGNGGFYRFLQDKYPPSVAQRIIGRLFEHDVQLNAAYDPDAGGPPPFSFYSPECLKQSIQKQLLPEDSSNETVLARKAALATLRGDARGSALPSYLRGLLPSNKGADFASVRETTEHIIGGDAEIFGSITDTFSGVNAMLSIANNPLPFYATIAEQPDTPRVGTEKSAQWSPQDWQAAFRAAETLPPHHTNAATRAIADAAALVKMDDDGNMHLDTDFGTWASQFAASDEADNLRPRILTKLAETASGVPAVALVAETAQAEDAWHIPTTEEAQTLASIADTGTPQEVVSKIFEGGKVNLPLYLYAISKRPDVRPYIAPRGNDFVVEQPIEIQGSNVPFSIVNMLSGVTLQQG